MADTYRQLAEDMLKELNYECTRMDVDHFDECNKRVTALEERLDKLINPPDIEHTKLEVWMFQKGITVRELAENALLAQPTVSRILGGKQKPGKKAQRQIMDALGWRGEWDELFEVVA